MDSAAALRRTLAAPEYSAPLRRVLAGPGCLSCRRPDSRPTEVAGEAVVGASVSCEPELCFGTTSAALGRLLHDRRPCHGVGQQLGEAAAAAPRRLSAALEHSAAAAQQLGEASARQ
eukprot:15431310-Alexandrium_andersonii.AAC.1